MKRIKRSKFWMFLYSLVPGAAEMFSGLMKQGVSLMAIFFGALLIPSFLRLGDEFVLFAILAWFYGFFHAMNLMSYTQEELDRVQDDWVWSGVQGCSCIKNKGFTWLAVLLIVAGCSLLWRSITSPLLGLLYTFFVPQAVDAIEEIVSRVPRVAIAVIIIVAGVRMIRGTKAELKNSTEENTHGTEA